MESSKTEGDAKPPAGKEAPWLQNGEMQPGEKEVVGASGRDMNLAAFGKCCWTASREYLEGQIPRFGPGPVGSSTASPPA